VNDPKKQEKRRRMLKERRAEQGRDFDRVEARYLYQIAENMEKSGDAPGAARTARKALNLDPDCYAALDLLARIHFAADQFEQAASYLTALREYPQAVSANYNLGHANLKLGRRDEARKNFQDFIELTRSMPGSRWRRLREEARLISNELAKSVPPAPPPPAPRPSAPKRQEEIKAPPAQPAPAPEPRVPPPRTTVDFLSSPPPVFTQDGVTLADYLLRRRLLELRIAQSFEDLVCLPSLNGVDTYMYQQETVRRVLRHFKGRALLADEVGLGKTIEACLVLKEYWARGMVRRVLVLTPPSLVSQWRGELAEKFGMTSAAPDDSAFRSDPGRFWREEAVIVASIAMVRLEPHASTLAGIAWDMVIVDEAHCLKNRTSANWKLVNSLDKKFILMLTATPVENNLVELYNLITVLKPGLLATEADFRKQFVVAGKPRASRNADGLRTLLAEVMVRNTRSAVDVRLPHRIAASVVVLPSPAEAKLYGMVSDYVASRYRPSGGGNAGAAQALALHLLQRQAGSSAPALARATGRLLAAGHRHEPAGRRDLEAIHDMAGQVPWSGKGLHLGRMLAEREAKTVVFTEFTATLEHLAQVCEQHSLRYVLFNGEMSKAEKDAAIARFRDDANVLLSTASGGEGRNLQFANTVVNFDLPWNPMRLEQRVGRVHRIGQTQEVFVFNFCQADTVEEQLLRVLHDKINMFELVVGEVDAILGTLDEGDFAALVLDLWLSGRGSGDVGQAFDEFADRLIAAKRQYSETKQLDEALFQRDFEV
jgi:superfamily II DNA or RNA helicase/Tfp pilus assembly protein PilF